VPVTKQAHHVAAGGAANLLKLTTSQNTNAPGDSPIPREWDWPLPSPSHSAPENTTAHARASEGSNEPSRGIDNGDIFGEQAETKHKMQNLQKTDQRLSLQRFVTEEDGWSCTGCGANFPHGTVLFGCRRTNIDYCVDCFRTRHGDHELDERKFLGQMPIGERGAVLLRASSYAGSCEHLDTGIAVSLETAAAKIAAAIETAAVGEVDRLVASVQPDMQKNTTSAGSAQSEDHVIRHNQLDVFGEGVSNATASRRHKKGSSMPEDLQQQFIHLKQALATAERDITDAADATATREAQMVHLLGNCQATPPLLKRAVASLLHSAQSAIAVRIASTTNAALMQIAGSY